MGSASTITALVYAWYSKIVKAIALHQDLLQRFNYDQLKAT